MRFFTLLILSLVFCCHHTSLNAQSFNNALKLNIHLGTNIPILNADSYTQTISHPSFRSSSNITTGTSNSMSPSIHIGLIKPLSRKWKAGLYAEYLYDQGDLYSNQGTHGHSDGIPFEHMFPSQRKLHWFNLGAIAYYKIIEGRRSSISIGSGMTVLFSKHHYRNEAAFILNENNEVISMTESFVTTKRSSTGIPLYAEYNYHLNENIQLTLGAQASAYFNVNYIGTGLFIGAYFDIE